MKLAPGLAAVIRGDGEAAVLTMSRAISAGRVVNWAKVPNAVWRSSDGAVRDNGITFVLSGRGAARLRHARFDLMLHPEEYNGAGMPADLYGPAFSYSPGRGCTYGCAFAAALGSRRQSLRGAAGTFFTGPGRLSGTLGKRAVGGLMPGVYLSIPGGGGTNGGACWARSKGKG